MIDPSNSDLKGIPFDGLESLLQIGELTTFLLIELIRTRKVIKKVLENLSYQHNVHCILTQC